VVFGVHGLAGDTQSVSDLLPRPALSPGGRDVVSFDPLSQAMERQRGAKPNCRVIGGEVPAELLDVHACQFELTSVICQSKLTRPGGCLTRPAAGEGKQHVGELRIVSYLRLPRPYVLAIGILGLLMMLAALIVEIAMGNGMGHRYLVIHGVQFAGALLVVVSLVLDHYQKTAKRR
jgi:hypothetical protein